MYFLVPIGFSAIPSTSTASIGQLGQLPSPTIVNNERENCISNLTKQSQMLSQNQRLLQSNGVDELQVFLRKIFHP